MKRVSWLNANISPRMCDRVCTAAITRDPITGKYPTKATLEAMPRRARALRARRLTAQGG